MKNLHYSFIFTLDLKMRKATPDVISREGKAARLRRFQGEAIGGAQVGSAPSASVIRLPLTMPRATVIFAQNWDVIGFTRQLAWPGAANGNVSMERTCGVDLDRLVDHATVLRLCPRHPESH